MKMKTLFTSESVSMGHPDKICDQIADRILDAYLSLDSASHVAIEVMARENEVYVSGEVTSSVKIEIEPIVKATLVDIG
ncbi:MAG: S-adenosylmethionine synthetase N-terminal domain-containing protein, partial [Coprobacillus sp.]|nr:S-adenosylmethionine synthetase N-terminal domain-containing protein [Coprobacillus sp.]